MIPTAEIELNANVPPRFHFWMPAEGDIPEDEGIGYFRDVWMIINAPIESARQIVADEAELVSIAGKVAKSIDDFESLAQIMEAGYEEGMLPDHILGELRRKAPQLVDPSEEDGPSLQGLELGVAGLTYALSTIGAVPVASCRGHENGWSDLPVVFVAIDEQRARWVQPLVQATGCGFDIDQNRGEFLMIRGRSALHTNKLAGRIVSEFNGQTDLFDRWLFRQEDPAPFHGEQLALFGENSFEDVVDGQ